MEKMQPPPYNEIYPTAPPVDQNNIYPNVPQPVQWNQPPQQYPPAGYTAVPHQQPVQMIQPTRQVVVINQQLLFGENPIAMTCPSCQQQTLSKIEYESNIINHSVALGLCVIGFWCCCCIPYCVDSIKDVVHKCGKCGAFLGKYRRGRV